MKFLCTLLMASQAAWASTTIQGLLDQYITIQALLAGDNFGKAKEEATEFVETAATWLEENANAPHKDRILQAKEIADKLLVTVGPEHAPLAFGRFSREMVDFVRAKPELQASLQLFYCPMYKESGADYGYWFQPMGEKIANPYFGSKMLTCGAKKKWNQ